MWNRRSRASSIVVDGESMARQCCVKPSNTWPQQIVARIKFCASAKLQIARRASFAHIRLPILHVQLWLIAFWLPLSDWRIHKFGSFPIHDTFDVAVSIAPERRKTFWWSTKTVIIFRNENRILFCEQTLTRDTAAQRTEQRKKKCVHAPSRRNNKYAECRYADKRIITICGVFATSNKYTHIDAGTCSIIIASMMRDEWRRRSRKSANAKTIYRHRHHFPWDIDRSAGCHLEKLVNGAQPSRRYESKCEEWTVHIARYLYTLWIRLPPHRLCQFFFHEFEFQYPLLQAPWYRRPMRTGNGGLCQWKEMNIFQVSASQNAKIENSNKCQ